MDLDDLEGKEKNKNRFLRFEIIFLDHVQQYLTLFCPKLCEELLQ